MTCLTRTSRKVWSRVLMGLACHGQYYFITWTSSPQSPPLDKSWDALRKWLKRERPGCSWCYCWTDEGHGVIHMVVRLGKGERRFNVTRVRAHWDKLHNARQIKIRPVKKETAVKLMSYIANQKKIKKMANEFMYQSSITRWGWSKGWIPKGFTKQFGKLWFSWLNADEKLRLKVVNDALQACFLDESKVQMISEWSRVTYGTS